MPNPSSIAQFGTLRRLPPSCLVYSALSRWELGITWRRYARVEGVQRTATLQESGIPPERYVFQRPSNPQTFAPHSEHVHG